MLLHLLNAPGLVILAIGFGVAWVIGSLFGDTREAALMVIGNPLIVSGDLAYRLLRKEGHWLHPWKGGMCVFLPVWILGVFWFGLGVHRLWVGQPPAAARPAPAAQVAAPANGAPAGANVQKPVGK
jgi:hypothetical protein